MSSIGIALTSWDLMKKIEKQREKLDKIEEFAERIRNGNPCEGVSDEECMIRDRCKHCYANSLKKILKED